MPKTKRPNKALPKSHVVIAADHAGYDLKRYLVPQIVRAGYPVEDIGPAKPDLHDDYPDYAVKVAKHAAADPSCAGVLICCTGIGMAMAANKVPGARAANCTDKHCARMARQDNDANVLALRGRGTPRKEALLILMRFLETPFSGKERHIRRIKKLGALDQARGKRERD